MMALHLLAVLVLLVGLVVYLVSSKPEAKELGRLAFFAGLLVVLLRVGEAVVRVG